MGRALAILVIGGGVLFSLVRPCDAASVIQESPAPAGPSPTVSADGIPMELRPAVDALGKGDLGRALKLGREFVKANPRSAIGHEFLGDVAVRRDDVGH